MSYKQQNTDQTEVEDRHSLNFIDFKKENEQFLENLNGYISEGANDHNDGNFKLNFNANIPKNTQYLKQEIQDNDNIRPTAESFENYYSTGHGKTSVIQDICQEPSLPADSGLSKKESQESSSRNTRFNLPSSTPSFNIVPLINISKHERDDEDYIGNNVKIEPRALQPPQIFVTPENLPRVDTTDYNLFMGLSQKEENFSNKNISQKYGYLDSSEDKPSQSSSKVGSPLLHHLDITSNDSKFGSALHPVLSNESGYYTASEMQSPRSGSVVDFSDVENMMLSPMIPRMEFEDFSRNGNNSNECLAVERSYQPDIPLFKDNNKSMSMSQAVNVGPNDETSVLSENNNKGNIQNFEFINDELLDQLLLNSIKHEENDNDLNSIGSGITKVKKEKSPFSPHLLSPSNSLFVEDGKQRSRSRSISKNSSGARSRSISRDRSKIEQLTQQLNVPDSINQNYLSSDGEFENSDYDACDLDTVDDFKFDENQESLYNKQTSEYHCPICDKGFVNKPSLQSHMKSHTLDKPFKCSYCEKSFARQHDTRRHENLHTGEKWFMCGGLLGNGEHWGCSKQFARSDALGRHLKTKVGQRCLFLLYDEFLENRFENNPNKHILQHNLDEYLLPSVTIAKDIFTNICEPRIEHNFLKLAQLRAHSLKQQNKAK